MKSLIIENQWEIPDTLQEFIDQNPDKVGEVSEIINALSMDLADVGAAISGVDMLLMETTFYYKEQLESILHALYAGQFGPRIKKVACVNLLDKLDRWTKPYKPSPNSWTILEDGSKIPDPERPLDYSWDAKSGFEDHALFLAQLIELVQTERLELYDISNDHRVHRIGDTQLMYFDTAVALGLTREDIEWQREEHALIRICYSAELRRFHYEGTEPDPDAYRY